MRDDVRELCGCKVLAGLFLDEVDDEQRAARLEERREDARRVRDRGEVVVRDGALPRAVSVELGSGM